MERGPGRQAGPDAVKGPTHGPAPGRNTRRGYNGRMRRGLNQRLPPTYDLSTLGKDGDLYSRLEAFADRFGDLADREVGPAFSIVPAFSGQAAAEVGREEEFYRRTTRERYLLELLAVTVMARQFWPAFAARRDTVLILPDCLRLKEKGCGRKNTRMGPRCTICYPDCLVGRITAAGRRFGVQAYFAQMGHPRQFRALRRTYPDLSVVGVACIWMLAAGMRAAEEAGIPSQGVLLTYCGCEHWTDDPFVTDASVARVEAILEAKARERGRLQA